MKNMRMGSSRMYCDKVRVPWSKEEWITTCWITLKSKQRYWWYRWLQKFLKKFDTLYSASDHSLIINQLFLWPRSYLQPFYLKIRVVESIYIFLDGKKIFKDWGYKIPLINMNLVWPLLNDLKPSIVNLKYLKQKTIICKSEKNHGIIFRTQKKLM